jgi:hypothetical protein
MVVMPSKPRWAPLIFSLASIFRISTNLKMEYSHQEIYERLLRIYKKHKKLYKRNPDSKQLCCMWSITDPPDIIEDTPPFLDIENAFNFSIDEDDCLELYDMSIEEAVVKFQKS